MLLHHNWLKRRQELLQQEEIAKSAPRPVTKEKYKVVIEDVKDPESVEIPAPAPVKRRRGRPRKNAR